MIALDVSHQGGGAPLALTLTFVGATAFAGADGPVVRVTAVPFESAVVPSHQASDPPAPSRSNEIDELYAELRALGASSDGSDPAIDVLLQDRLTRLRELQEAEAREMAAFAERRRALPRSAADALFKQVDALLERHEHPSGSDRSGGQRG